MSTTPLTNPIVSVETIDGTAANTRIYWLGIPMRSDVELVRIFQHSSDKAKTASLSVLVKIPVATYPDGTVVKSQQAIDLLGAKAEKKWIDFLFGTGAYDQAYPEPITDDGSSDGTTSDPTPDDGYTSSDGTTDLTMAPYDYYITSRTRLYYDTFPTLDTSIWTLTNNMAHSVTSEVLVSTGTGQAVGTISVPAGDSEIVLELEDYPVNFVTYVDNAKYSIWFKRIDHSDGTSDMRVSFINPSTSEIIYSEYHILAKKITFVKQDTNLHLIVDDGITTSEQYFANIFDTVGMTTFEWKTQAEVGVRQALTTLTVYELQTEVGTTPISTTPV